MSERKRGIIINARFLKQIFVQKTSNKFIGFMTLIKQQPEPDDDAHVGHKNSYLLDFFFLKIYCAIIRSSP